MISVLIADDQALVREGFRAILEREADITVVGEAVDGRQALELARSQRPDVVLMDVRMPGMDGLEATRRLTQASDGPRVLILTTFDRNELLYEAMKASASGFLLKDVRRGQLTEAIRTVAAGEELLAPAITKRLIEEFVRRPPHTAGTPAELVELSPRELEVLTLIGKGLSNAEIASTLFLGETTVKSHVGRILSKLDLRDRIQAVVLSYETGLIRRVVDEGESAAAVGVHRGGAHTADRRSGKRERTAALGVDAVARVLDGQFCNVRSPPWCSKTPIPLPK